MNEDPLHVSLSTAKLLERLKPDVRAQQQRAFDQMGVKSIPMETWIDE